MTQPRNERLLNWGFTLSLAFHAVALGAATLLPTVVVGDDLTDVRVFRDAAPQLMTPVELVELPAETAPVAPAPTELIEGVPEEPQPAPTAPKAPPEPTRPEPRPRPTQPPQPAPKPQQKPAPQPPTPAVNTKPVEPEPAPPDVTATPPEGRPGGGGGGGGGEVNLGTPSANGDLPGAPGTATPPGELPGSGSGSGSGSGAGSGGGSGDGTGGGVGTGAGTGTGEGSGSGSGGGEGEGGSNGFSSRVADRKEPVVIYKGSLLYPPSAISEGVEGSVKLRVLVTEKGTVAEVTVAQSSYDRRLDAAAMAFVKEWRYQPAVQDGQPRSVYTYALVTFELR